MKDVYLKNYRDSRMLSSSLDLLSHRLSWVDREEKPLTITDFGPLFLSINNAPFVFAFLEVSRQALYHASNAWRRLILNLSHPSDHYRFLKEDAILLTGDKYSKYEIEAFHIFVNTISEENIVGAGNRNRLGLSKIFDERSIEFLRNRALVFNKRIGALGLSKLRNDIVHWNPVRSDLSGEVIVFKRDSDLICKINFCHSHSDMSFDLVDVFLDSFNMFSFYVSETRYLLLDFAFKHIALPRNTIYATIYDDLGNMMVGLGPNGFETKHFPVTVKSLSSE